MMFDPVIKIHQKTHLGPLNFLAKMVALMMPKTEDLLHRTRVGAKLVKIVEISNIYIYIYIYRNFVSFKIR